MREQPLISSGTALRKGKEKRQSEVNELKSLAIQGKLHHLARNVGIYRGRQREFEPSPRAASMPDTSRGSTTCFRANGFRFCGRRTSAAPPRGRGSFQRFIGVTPRPELADRLGPTNAAARAGTADAMRPETRRMLAQRYEEPNQRLAELLGTGFMMWIQ